MSKEKDKEIKKLKDEIEFLKDKASRDFLSWKNTVNYSYERIGEALDKIREKRPTGEPARSDAEEIELLVKHFIKSKSKELLTEGCLLQRTKGGGYVGNSILWWAKNDHGYTTNPFEAKIWPTKDAIEYTKGREDEYLAYPISLIKDCISCHIDMQHVDQKQRLEVLKNYE